MIPFTYRRAASLAGARTEGAHVGAAFLAGGTTLLDLAKSGVARPIEVVDISRLPGLDSIIADTDGLRIGALARMSRVAADDTVLRAAPAVAQALSLSASTQIRNMATIGGNLMQRTRCTYFRDPAGYPACNKRLPGSGCTAVDHVSHTRALLGGGDACMATHPGDLAVALVALDAMVEIGERSARACDFFLLPGSTPHHEFALDPGEIITGIRIPACAAAQHSTYLKLRERASYEFATVSVAVGLALDATECLSALHIAIGGVATVPWRARKVEAALLGRRPTPEAVSEASMLAMQGAVATADNRHKLTLAPRLVARGIETLLLRESECLS